MDWDGVGTFALFLASGAVGVSVIALRAYQARLSSKLEWARMERESDGHLETEAQVRELEEQVRRLTERVEFTERLLHDGRRQEQAEIAAKIDRR